MAPEQTSPRPQERLTAGSGGAGDVLVSLSGISKRFGPIQALRDVDLVIRSGETHFILGENGAGKSTLMRILAGVQPPDSGVIVIRGSATRLHNRKEGVEAGIGMVQQHHGLVHQMTGVENFLLGQATSSVFLRGQHAEELLRRAADEFKLEIRPNRLVSQMAAGERQRLEIVIALASGSDLIILDEPTSALPTRDIEMLIEVVRRMKQRGKAVAYITHKLREVVALADQVTILRRGEVVAKLPGEGLDLDSLTTAMMGPLPPVETAARKAPGPVVARLRNVATSREPGGCPLVDVDLSVRSREVVGVAGMMGSGQDELAEVLVGLRVPSSGAIETRPRTVAYIPEDRASAGVAETLSVRDNCIVHRHSDPGFRNGVRLDTAKIERFSAELLRRNDVRAASVETRVGLLSGGNQQKLVVGRELDRDPDLIVAHNPYFGLDVNATRAVRARLREACERGCGLVFISPDLEDLFDMADRIVVLAEGSITGEVDPRATSPNELGALIGKTRAPLA